MTEERVMGQDGSLFWQLPSAIRRLEVLSRFDGTIITDDRALAHFPEQLLVGRKVVVVAESEAPDRKDVTFVPSVKEAVPIADGYTAACVVGGGKLYRACLAFQCTRFVEITRIRDKIDGSELFPELNSRWRSYSSTPFRLWDKNDKFYSEQEAYQRAP